MSPGKRKRLARRAPRQQRSRLSVEAMLDAAVKILKRDGVAAVTTNRIAEVAGVSIGSVYQYFPDKRAIFIALHKRHVEEIDRLIERTMIEHANSSLDTLVEALVDAMVNVHSKDPELYEMLFNEVPHRGGGTQDFATRLQGAFVRALSSSIGEAHGNLDRTAFVVAQMVEALSHGVALKRPANVSLAAARADAVQAVLRYVRP